VDEQYPRYTAGELGRFNSLYIVTKKDGRWGIKMRSSFETLI